MDNLQAVKDIFNSLSENEKINYWNDYCDKNRYYSDKIYNLDEFEIDSFFSSKWELAMSISDSDHFNYREYYFTVGDVYNDIKSGDWFEDLADPDDNFFEWLMEENPDEFTEEEEE